jgi:hypothetical protein
MSPLFDVWGYFFRPLGLQQPFLIIPPVPLSLHQCDLDVVADLLDIPVLADQYGSPDATYFRFPIHLFFTLHHKVPSSYRRDLITGGSSVPVVS